MNDEFSLAEIEEELARREATQREERSIQSLIQKFDADPSSVSDEELDLIENSNYSPVETFADEFADTALFGFKDEIASGVESMFGDKSYDEAQDWREQMRQYSQEQNPKSAIGGTVAGTLIPGAGTAGLMARGVKQAMTLPQKMKMFAKYGAGEGTLYGAGTAEQGLENRATGAAIGGTVGGVAGGVLPTAGPIAKRGLVHLDEGGLPGKVVSSFTGRGDDPYSITRGLGKDQSLRQRFGYEVPHTASPNAEDTVSKFMGSIKDKGMDVATGGNSGIKPDESIMEGVTRLATEAGGDIVQGNIRAAVGLPTGAFQAAKGILTLKRLPLHILRKVISSKSSTKNVDDIVAKIQKIEPGETVSKELADVMNEAVETVSRPSKITHQMSDLPNTGMKGGNYYDPAVAAARQRQKEMDELMKAPLTNQPGPGAPGYSNPLLANAPRKVEALVEEIVQPKFQFSADKDERAAQILDKIRARDPDYVAEVVPPTKPTELIRKAPKKAVVPDAAKSIDKRAQMSLVNARRRISSEEQFRNQAVWTKASQQIERAEEAMAEGDFKKALNIMSDFYPSHNAGAYGGVSAKDYKSMKAAEKANPAKELDANQLSELATKLNRLK